MFSMRALRSPNSWVTAPDVFLGHVDGEPLGGFVELAVDLAGDDLGLADGELEAFSAHHLDEDRELELAAALDFPGIGAIGWEHPERHVADELGVEAAFTSRAVSLLPSPPASGEVLTPMVTDSVGSSTEMTGMGRGLRDRRASRRS